MGSGRYGAPGRREIGYGALGERASAQVLPSAEESLMLSVCAVLSNGSSSQAPPICAGTWLLMAGGVLIKGACCRDSYGLSSDTNYTVLD